MELILVAFCLVSVAFQYNDGALDGIKNSLSLEGQYKYWEKDMAKMEFSTNVALRLVNKNWSLRGPHIPGGSYRPPTYPGTVVEADAILNDKDNMYKFEERPLDNGLQLMTSRIGYDKTLASIFIFHTISSDSADDFAKKMVIALAMRNYMQLFNVFVLHLPELQNSMHQTLITTAYGQRASYEKLGNTIGDFFHSAIQNGLIKAEQIHMLSFCYSSQLSGYVARYITQKNPMKKVKSITALDPYSVGLSSIRNKVLSRRDADYVFAYHTNSLVYGTIYRRATVDFVFNSGLIQPGCYQTLDPNCSHRRVVDLFTYIIIYPEKWLGRKCPAWLFFKSCICNSTQKAIIPFPPVMGIRGIYFLNTNANKPYGYGNAGTTCFTSDYDKSHYLVENENEKEDGKNPSSNGSPSTSPP